MKLSTTIFTVALAISSANASTIQPVDALITPSPSVPTTHSFDKRAKKVIINKDYQKALDEKERIAKGIESTSEAPKPWLRTIYGTIPEIVRPTVIAGVTFSAKPPKTTNGLEAWVSLNKDGSPKTIRPENKGGHIKKASPTYGTWFATATTKLYSHKELKAHNMAEDEIHEQVEYIDEDSTYHLLNPLIRCTPDYYKNKGLAKNIKSEPFCSPQDNASLKTEHTYFITWFSRFFDENVKNVRIHLSYVKETAMHKGLKRSLNETFENSTELELLDKRSSVLENGGKISQASFFISDWLENDDGYYPITIDPKWLGDKVYERKVLISIQPDNVDDEDFVHTKNPIVIEIAKKTKVSKGSLQDLKKLDEKQRLKMINSGEVDGFEDGIDYEAYIAMATMPTCVMLCALGMYFFVFINKKHTDLSHLKRRRFAGKNTTHKKLSLRSKKNKDYDALPQFSNDIEMTKHD